MNIQILLEKIPRFVCGVCLLHIQVAMRNFVPVKSELSEYAADQLMLRYLYSFHTHSAG